MPYIKKSDRPRYESAIRELARQIPNDRSDRPGHLNYIITMLLRTTYGSKMRYADHNEAIGVLECVKQELYRKLTAPYEDEKIVSEGDLNPIQA